MGRIPDGQAINWDTSPLPENIVPAETAGVRDVKLAEDASPVAREIYRRMRERGIGQKALAIAAGVNETYVRDLLKGKSKNPKQDHLDRIAQALACTLADLVNPGRPESLQNNESVAKSSEEMALLLIWRRASDVGRARILSAIERAMLGDLLGRGEVDDI